MASPLAGDAIGPLAALFCQVRHWRRNFVRAAFALSSSGVVWQ